MTLDPQDNAGSSPYIKVSLHSTCSLNTPRPHNMIFTSSKDSDVNISKMGTVSRLTGQGAGSAAKRWQALSPPPGGFPDPCPPRNQAFRLTQTLPDPPRRLPLPPPPPSSFPCEQDGSWTGETSVLSSFHASACDQRSFFLVSRLAWGSHARCRVEPSRGHSWLSLGTHLEARLNLSLRSRSVLTEPE